MLLYHHRMSAHPRTDLAPALGAALLPLVAYLGTVAPTVYGLDSAELTTAAYILGIPHAPGSPTFQLLGHLFTWIPIGDVGYRVNMLSSFAAAAGLPFVYAIHRSLGASILLSLAATWVLAFSYYYWITAVAAELYAPQAMFTAILIAQAVYWRLDPTPLRVGLMTLVFGLGLGVHLSIVLLAPGLAYLTFSGAPQQWRRPALWIAAAAGLLLGSSVYLYLPLRSHSPLNFAREFGVDLRTWDGFWWMVRGEMFSSRFFGVPTTQWPGEIALYAFRLWSNFLGMGCFLGAVGLANDFSRRPAVHLSLLLMFGAHLAFFLPYAVSDKQVMLVPSYLVWSLWISLGVAAVARLARSVPAISAVALTAFATAMLFINYPLVDLSDDWSARERAEAILDTLPHGSTFVGTWREIPAIKFLQLVEGRAPTIKAIDTFFIPTGYQGQFLDDLVAARESIYTSSPRLLGRPKSPSTYHPACDCFEIVGCPDRQPVCRKIW